MRSSKILSIIPLLLIIVPSSILMAHQPHQGSQSSTFTPSTVSYNGSSLSGWTGDLTINTSKGNPPPSFYANTGHYSYIDVGSLKGKYLHIANSLGGTDNTGGLIFMANSSGRGNAMGISYTDSAGYLNSPSPSNAAGSVFTSSSWSSAFSASYTTTPDMYEEGYLPLENNNVMGEPTPWANFTISINPSGTKATIRDGSTVFSNISVSDFGNYIGIGNDPWYGSSNNKVWFDNIQIYTPKPLSYANQNFTYSQTNGSWNEKHVFFTWPDGQFYVDWHSGANTTVSYNGTTEVGTSGKFNGSQATDEINFIRTNKVDTNSYDITWQTGINPKANITSSQNPNDDGALTEFSSSVSYGTPPYSYSWEINNKSYSGKDVNVTFPSTGTYKVNLTVKDSAGNVAEATYNETINKGPSIVASSNLSEADTNFPIEFTSQPSGGTGGYNFSWKLNGKQISPSQDFSHSFNSPGNYTLTATVTDSVGETSSALVSVTINPAPSAVIESSLNPCDVGDSVMFNSSVTGGTGNLTYKWLLNGTVESYGKSFSYSFQNSGNYTISLTVTDGEGESSTATFTQQVNNDPKVSITSSPSPTDVGVITSFKTVISGGTSKYNYNWSIDGQNFTSPEVNFTFNSSGTYTIDVAVTDESGNTARATTSEIVNAYPSVSVAAKLNPVDSGENDSFIAQATGGTDPVNYTWFNGTVVIGYGQTVTYLWDSPGSYNITVKVRDSLNSTAADTFQVKVIKKPSTSIEGPVNVDTGVKNSWMGNSTNGSSPYTYTWLINGVKSGSGLIFTYSFPTAGDYRIELISSDSLGFVSNAYLNVTVSPYLTVSVNAEYTTIDRGIVDSFNSTTSGGSSPIIYRWTISGIGEVGHQNALFYSFQETGVFNITLTGVDAQGVSSTSSVSVTVVSDPSVNVSAEYPVTDPFVNDSLSATVSGGVGAISIKWTENGTIIGSASSISHAFDTPGIYVIKVTVEDSFKQKGESSFDIIVRDYPAASILQMEKTIDSGSTDTLRASAIDGVGPYSFEWIIHGNSYYGPDLAYQAGSPGNVSVQLIVSDYFGKDASTTLTLHINSDPSVALSYKGPVEASIPVNLSAEVTGGTPGYKVQWIFESGLQESGFNASHSFSISGTRDIEILVIDSSGYRGTYNFTISVRLFVEASASQHSGVGPLRVSFYGSALGGNDYLYNWTFSNGNYSLKQNPVETFQVGNFTVNLTVKSSNGATGYYELRIESLPEPIVISYNPAENITVKTDVNFTAVGNWDSGGIHNVSWSFPNGQTLFGSSVRYEFPVFIEFNDVVVSYVTGNNQTGQQVIRVRMVPATPSISVTLPEFIAKNTFIVLNSSASSPDAQIVNYSWNVNGTTYYGQYVPYTFSKTGNITVTATATDSLGASVSKKLIVDVLPVGSSNSISISVKQSVSQGYVTFEVNVKSAHGIAVVEALQGTNLLVPKFTNKTDGYNYNLTLNERDYSPGNYPVKFIVFNNNSQSNEATATFTVSSQYGKTPYGFIQTLGPTNFVLMIVGIVAVIGGLVALHERSERIIEIPGTDEEMVGRNGHKLFLRKIRRRHDL